jgi:hypothetical protein
MSPFRSDNVRATDDWGSSPTGRKPIAALLPEIRKRLPDTAEAH